MAELVDRLLGEADDVQVDDLSVARTRGDIDDASEEGLGGVTSDDERAGLDSLGLVARRHGRPRQVEIPQTRK